MLGLARSLPLTYDLKLNFSTYRKFLTFLNNHVPEGFVNVNSSEPHGQYHGCLRRSELYRKEILQMPSRSSITPAYNV